MKVQATKDTRMFNASVIIMCIPKALLRSHKALDSQQHRPQKDISKLKHFQMFL